MLHDGRNDDAVRAFFVEVHEVYVKVLLNPFYMPNSRVESRDFDSRVKASAKRHLGYRD
jgi:trafficking protein particle complex subunit 2